MADGMRDVGEFVDEYLASLPWRYRMYALGLQLWWKVVGRPKLTIADVVLTKGSTPAPQPRSERE